MYENILQFVRNIQQPSHYSNDFPAQGHSYQGSTALQPVFTDTQTNTSENVDQLQSSVAASEILPEDGSITHNVMRMLNGSSEQLPVASSRDARYRPYTTAHFLSFRRKMLNQQTRSEYEGDDHEQTASNVSNPDMSISTDGSVSPSMSGFDSSNSSRNSFDSLRLTETPTSVNISSLSDSSSSSDTSPRSEREGTSSPPPSKTPEYKEKKNVGQSKKGSRTNYTNEQIQALLKIFLETPYPDSEMMETIGKDLGIPEKKVKIWFQNKRARWRRRVNEMNNNNTQRFLPVSPITPYGYMPTGPMMTSSPVSRTSGYYPWIHGPSHQNNNLPVSHFSTNQFSPAFIPSNQSALLQTHAHPGMSMPPFVPQVSSAQYSRTPTQQSMISKEIRPSNIYPMNNRSYPTMC